jgi:enterochelin esterase-like enzyme
LVLVLLSVVAAGVTGAIRYGVTYWLYRGFSPPVIPATVVVKTRGGGSRLVRVAQANVVSIDVQSNDLGGWSDPVEVVLPPGYRDDPKRRYPVLYLLDGSPGMPSNYIYAGDLLVSYDVLLAERQIPKMIIVLPSGARNYFGDTEWANAVSPGNDWESFVSGALVRAIDDRFAADESWRGRAIAGLSEGGYGALNIALHHPSEFGVLESWSGYMLADRDDSVFGSGSGGDTLVRHNSPAFELPHVARLLRDHHVFVFLYVGSHDGLHEQSERFWSELRRCHVAGRLEVLPGAHSWGLWRSMMRTSLVEVAEHLRVSADARRAHHVGEEGQNEHAEWGLLDRAGRQQPATVHRSHELAAT